MEWWQIQIAAPQRWQTALLATDVVDYLVKKKVPFRQAHHIVGELVALAEKLALPLNQLPYDAVVEVHPSLEKDWNDVFDLASAMAGREKSVCPDVNK